MQCEAGSPEPNAPAGASENMLEYVRNDSDEETMSTKSKGTKEKQGGTHAVQFTPGQVQQVQEAIRRAERDMSNWREQSRVDPQKMKEPLTR